MSLLNDEILQNVKQMLTDLPNAVQLVVFTTKDHCDYCKEIVQLSEEVAAVSDKVSVEVNDIQDQAEKAETYNITMAPAIAIVGAQDYGLRYYGIPSGHEFSTLLYGIQKASQGRSELDQSTQTYLANLDQPVHLQVFVTPTCPYCPRSAILAYDMAVASDQVLADVVESMEFQELSTQFNVMGVPLNVINGQERVEGAAPPQMMLEAIQKTLA